MTTLIPSIAQVFWRSLLREAGRLRASLWDLSLISWIPALAVVLLLWIFSAGLPNRLPIGVLDQDHSSLTRQLTRFLQATPGLDLVRSYADPAEAEAGLRRAEVYAVLRIPAQFTRDVKHGLAGQVTLLHNAQFGTHSGLIQRDVRTVVGTLSAGVELSTRTKRGESLAAARVSMEPLRTSTVSLFNVSGNYEQFLGLALLPALLHILAMTAGAWTVGRELRDRSLGDWLAAPSSRLRFFAALLGKLLWPLASLGLIGAAALLWLTWGRGWYPGGSLAWTLLALLVFLALSLAMGAACAAVTRSLRTALSATGFITAPAFAFSGVGFPLVAMPPLARDWALALPLTHYIRLQIEQLQMAAPLRYSLSTPLWMLLATLLLLAVSAWGLRRAAAAPESWGGR